ncbi:hypothetical protein RHSIM_RhsimUnG0217700 [Rhododendron simsii]|uniref:Uncharacterized protein n=1 Tax=Rhododendron simsii TaxID=118357 RepID=A0A834FU62_RHOSS|nr:hypothetical protein RHSIM_RhsimUnG0217700 [Rhododendron simsii]
MQHSAWLTGMISLLIYGGLSFKINVITLISDHIPFSGVCKIWRSIGLEYRTAKFPTNVPVLIIPGGTTTTSKTRRLLAFPVGKNISNKENDLPLLSAPHESLCRGSHQDWLVMVNKSMSMYLHNRPDQWWPDQPPSRDFHPEAPPHRGILSCPSGLCKVGDHKDWRLIDQVPKNSWHIDDDSVEFDEDDHIDGGQYYDINEDEDGTGSTFKLEVSTGSEPKWVGVKDLDGGAVFLGLNQSLICTVKIKRNGSQRKSDLLHR